MPIAALLTFVLAVTGAGCGTDGASETSRYCADLADLVVLLDDGRSIDEYNDLLAEVVEGSPVGHGVAWALMLKLSEETFTYENFNPAVDALDLVDFEATCPDLDRFVVDDDGRVRGF